MASAGARAYNGGHGRSPQRGPGAEPLVMESGGDEAESIGGGSYWAGRAAARPLFRLRGPQICLARPLLAT